MFGRGPGKAPPKGTTSWTSAPPQPPHHSHPLAARCPSGTPNRYLPPAIERQRAQLPPPPKHRTAPGWRQPSLLDGRARRSLWAAKLPANHRGAAGEWWRGE